MPTLQIKLCPRLAVVTLLALAVAQLATQADAGVQVEVRGVSEDIRANVLAYLSFERYKNSDDLSPEFVERLQERSEREVRSALRPFGFYEPTVTSEVKKPEGNGGDQNYRVAINITPGEAVIVEKVAVKVTGPGATEPVFTNITNDLPIQVRDRLNHANYEALKGGLLRAAATYGYLDARMTRNEMRVDPEAHTAQIEIEFETGERYNFGETVISQNAIEESLVRRFLRYQTGQPFDATQLLRTQFALDDSQYFATVEVLPEDRDRQRHTVPVSIAAEPNRRNRYQFGVGYGTDTQVRGTAAWEDRRINQHGHRFRTEAKASALTQSLDGRYIVPIGDPATEKFTLQLTGKHDRLADVDDRNINFIPSFTHVRGPWFGNFWQRVSYVEFLHTESEFVGSHVKDVQNLLIPGISFSLVPRNYLGEALFSRTLFAELRGSHTALGSDSDFLQIRIQGERVFDIAPKWHVLLRGDIGATAVSQTSDLAPSQRFFAGGDRSVRGFAVNDLSPVQQVIENGVPQFNDDLSPKLEKVGGKHLFAGSVELVRDLPRNFAIALFTDAGNAFDNFGDPLMYSVGLGVRFRLPVVSVGIDVAQALTIPAGSTERPGPRLHLNFSPKL
ncbi:MAG TPA: BamA/TamA family outer membrane protein [Steroidobacteraceae bacterium]|jgi:translocation and assembly module TamA|nr:BamA/TamA family outer membrane protein [Steroidobacteraceae bacterium]